MKKSGFTLIELMVVVGIIGFLSSLAIPAYFKYLAKAKQAEVSINLASLHSAQQLYFAEHGEYSSDLSKIGWKPASNNHFYTYGFNTPNARKGKQFFIGKLKASSEDLKSSNLEGKTFVACAAGDIAGNGKLDVWSIDETRNITHIQNGLD